MSQRVRLLLLIVLVAISAVFAFQLKKNQGIVQTIHAQQPRPLRVIGFMTDFDVKDDAIGICKAVMEGVAPGVRVIDITHQVTPFDIAEGARFLAGSAPYFAKDAVFVGVVDPGVGSTRKPIIAKSKNGQYFLVPEPRPHTT